jgi:predicted membrane metal-binding protein
LITPAMLIPFFKSGPFAYNGLLALYLPFGAFFLWMTIMTPSVLRAIGSQREPGTSDGMAVRYGV